MVARIVAARTRPDSSYVIVGDMNDVPDSQFLEPMIADLELGLVDALANPTETRPAKAKASPESTPVSPAWTYRHRETGPQPPHALRPDLAESGAGRQAGRRMDRPPHAPRRRRQRP